MAAPSHASEIDLQLDKLSSSYQHFGDLKTLKVKQRESLQLVYDTNCDLIVNLPTGYGKSLIYQVLAPLLRLRNGRTAGCVLVISPLTAIQTDQVKQLKKIGLKACRIDVTGRGKCLEDANVSDSDDCSDSVYPGDDLSLTLWSNVPLQDIKEGKFDIVTCHPEALFCTRQGVRLLSDSTFSKNVLATVVDEAHKVDDWSREFRRAFGELHTLPAFFPGVSHVAMSGTLTSVLKKRLPCVLGLFEPKIIEETPDRPNLFLDRKVKGSNVDIWSTYETIYVPLFDTLKNDTANFPVTLLFLPMERMAEAVSYGQTIFGKQSAETTLYGVIYSNQDRATKDIFLTALKMKHSTLRLLLCTSTIGMGFNPPGVERVVHAAPPRNLSDYFQQIGRAGRSGQEATALLHFNASDMAANLPGIKDDIVSYCKTEDCLRECILNNFGFSKDSSSPRGCKCCCRCALICDCGC